MIKSQHAVVATAIAEAARGESSRFFLTISAPNERRMHLDLSMKPAMDPRGQVDMIIVSPLSVAFSTPTARRSRSTISSASSDRHEAPRAHRTVILPRRAEPTSLEPTFDRLAIDAFDPVRARIGAR